MHPARKAVAGLDEARREIETLNQCVREGFAARPLPGDTSGCGAVRVAAGRLGVDRRSLADRVGNPDRPGSYFRRFGLQPDWDAAEKVAAERGEHPKKFEPVLPGYAIKRTTTRLDKDGQVATQYVTQTKAPGPKGEIPAGHILSGVSQLRDAEGRVMQEWVKTKTDPSAVDIVAAIKTTFDGYFGRAELTPPPAEILADLLSVYVVTDVHHGLLAWGREAGEDYDIQIGSERLRSCMSDLVSQARPTEEALILNLGDYFHNNDQRNVTPASGHQLDVDSRFFKVAVTGVALHKDIIDLALQKHARVRVRIIRGNHDPESSITLQIALAAFYANEQRVIVELDPADVFFYRFGVTLIGACHGHNMKPDKMAMTMAMMRPEDWGASLFRWFLFGHIHHDSVKEIGNVRCESFETIAAKDAYAASHGYLSGQSMNCVTLHRERGEIGRHRVNVVPALSRAA